MGRKIRKILTINRMNRIATEIGRRFPAAPVEGGGGAGAPAVAVQSCSRLRGPRGGGRQADRFAGGLPPPPNQAITRGDNFFQNALRLYIV